MKQCGRKSQKYSHGCGECNRDREISCHLCRQKGHRQFHCPDRWRRYHSTVCYFIEFNSKKYKFLNIDH